MSVHESAHGWMASQMGDDTARSQGRVTLNPLAHIDPIGTVLMPLMQLLGGGIPFLAWAKPTPVGAHNFRRLARGHVLVAGAGPVSNLILSLLFTALLFVAVRVPLDPGLQGPLFSILTAGVEMNVGLAVFNLLPVPPLDGSWIASWGLPRPLGLRYDRIMEPLGGWLLLLLVMTGAVGMVLRPLVFLFEGFLYSLVR